MTPVTTGARRPEDAQFDLADHVGEAAQCGQPLARPFDARDQRFDVSQIEPDDEKVRHRIGDRRAGQGAQNVVLRRQHGAGRSEGFGLLALHPGHAGEHVAGADRQRRAEPADALFRRCRRIEFGRLGRGAVVLPAYRRHQRPARAIDEHVRIDLAAKARRRHSLGAPL